MFCIIAYSVIRSLVDTLKTLIMIDNREIRVGNCFNIKNSKEVVFVDSILSLDKEILH